MHPTQSTPAPGGHLERHMRRKSGMTTRERAWFTADINTRELELEDSRDSGLSFHWGESRVNVNDARSGSPDPRANCIRR